VQPAALCWGRVAGQAWCARRHFNARGECFKNWFEDFDRRVVATRHQAVATLEAMNAAANSAVNMVNAKFVELLGATDVVNVIAVAAVDDDVTGFKMLCKARDNAVNKRCGHHQPDDARRFKLSNKF